MNTPNPPTLSPDLQSLLSEFDASCQSAAAFARTRGIAVWRLRYAISRRAGTPQARSLRKTAPRSALIPVHVVGSHPAAPASSLELLLDGGHRLRIVIVPRRPPGRDRSARDDVVITKVLPL